MDHVDYLWRRFIDNPRQLATFILLEFQFACFVQEIIGSLMG